MISSLKVVQHLKIIGKWSESIDIFWYAFLYCVNRISFWVMAKKQGIVKIAKQGFLVHRLP